MQPWVISVTAFLVGLVLGVLPTVAVFASRVAVLETRAAQLEKDAGKIEAQLTEIKRDLNGIGDSMRLIAGRA